MSLELYVIKIKLKQHSVYDWLYTYTQPWMAYASNYRTTTTGTNYVRRNHACYLLSKTDHWRLKMSALWHWQQAADLLNSSSHRYPCSVQYHYPDRLRRICRARPLNQECITYRFQATPILCSSNWTPDGRYLALTAKCMHAWPEHTLHNAKDVAEHKVYEHILTTNSSADQCHTTLHREQSVQHLRAFPGLPHYYYSSVCTHNNSYTEAVNVVNA